jgi:hypothetical protein
MGASLTEFLYGGFPYRKKIPPLKKTPVGVFKKKWNVWGRTLLLSVATKKKTGGKSIVKGRVTIYNS